MSSKTKSALTADDLRRLDLYAILGIDGDGESASKEAILKAYRRRALQLHPDKNPDNPRAAEQFDQLTKALELLSDQAARSAYDRLRAARRAAEERNRRLDSDRQRLKLDLERRENSALNRRSDEQAASQDLQAQIDRLRKQGSEILRSEKERLRHQLHQNSNNKRAAVQHNGTTMKVRWRESAAFGDEEIRSYFARYGTITHVIVRQRTALVEWARREDALAACRAERDTTLFVDVTLVGGDVQEPPVARVRPDPAAAATPNNHDEYESSVLARLRAAAAARASKQ